MRSQAQRREFAGSVLTIHYSSDQVHKRTPASGKLLVIKRYPDRTRPRVQVGLTYPTENCCAPALRPIAVAHAPRRCGILQWRQWVEERPFRRLFSASLAVQIISFGHLSDGQVTLRSRLHGKNITNA